MRSWVGRALGATLAALLAGEICTRDAHAVEPAPIRIVVEACPSSWDREVRLAMTVELGDQRLSTGSTEEHLETPESPPTAGNAASYELSIRCDDHRVNVVARDSQTGTKLERTLTDDLPAVTGPRVVALVAVELLTTLEPTLRRTVEASAEPSPPPPSAAVKPSPAPPPSPISVQAVVPRSSVSASSWSTVDGPGLFLTASGVYRTFLSTGGVDAWGGALDVRRASRGQGWSAAVGVEIAGGGRSTSIGQTSAFLASARTSAGVVVRVLANRLTLFADLGARAGAVRLSGRSDEPNVIASAVVRPWAGPVATLGAQRVFSWFCAELTAEGGWAAVAASGLVTERPVLAASGPWLAIALGIGYGH